MMIDHSPAHHTPPRISYPHGALEAQTRRLGDFAFMTHDYKLAAAMYDIGRKDYASEKAFQYAAGANVSLPRRTDEGAVY